MKNKFTKMLVTAVSLVLSMCLLVACGKNQKNTDSASKSATSAATSVTGSQTNTSADIGTSNGESDSHSEQQQQSDTSVSTVKTYSVSMISSGKGNMITDKQKVEEGGSVQFSDTHENGYYLYSLTVNGEDKSAQVENGKLTVNDVQADIEVSSVFKPGVAYATSKPIIDGKIDSFWSDAAKSDIANGHNATLTPAQSKGFFRLAYAKKGLYVIAIVNDVNVCEKDSFDLFVSETYLQKTTDEPHAYSTDKKDGQYGLTFYANGTVGYKAGFDASDSVICAATSNEDGYIVEAFIPLVGESAFAADKAIGVNAAINSYTSESDHQGTCYYSDCEGEFASAVTVTTADYANDVCSLAMMKIFAAPSGVTVNTYDVSFDANGGIAIDPVTVEEGDLLTRPAAPEQEGYVFDGWYNGETAYDFTKQVTGELSLTAHWSKAVTVAAPYCISSNQAFVYNGLKGAVKSVKAGDNALETEPSTEGDVIVAATSMATLSQGENVLTVVTDKGYTYYLTLTVNISMNDVVVPARTVSRNGFVYKDAGGNKILDFVSKDSVVLDFSSDVDGDITYATINGVNVLEKVAEGKMTFAQADLSAFKARETYKVIIGNEEKVAVCEVRFATFTVSTAAEFIDFYDASRTNRTQSQTADWYISIEADLDFSSFVNKDYSRWNGGDVALNGSGNTANGDDDTFEGVLEGNGHVLNGLGIIRYMFEKTAETTVIRNIAFTNMKYLSNSAKSASTGLIYNVKGGEISNVYIGGTYSNATGDCNGICAGEFATTTIRNVIVDMTAVTDGTKGGISNNITGNNAFRHDNYAIGNFDMLYSNDEEGHPGLFADKQSFFDSVTELKAEDGWNAYWEISSLCLKFGGTTVAQLDYSDKPMTTLGVKHFVYKDENGTAVRQFYDNDSVTIDLSDAFENAFTSVTFDGTDVSQYIVGKTIVLPKAAYENKTIGTEYTLIAKNAEKTHIQRVRFATFTVSTAAQFIDFYDAYRTNRANLATAGWLITIENDLDFSSFVNKDYSRWNGGDVALNSSGNTANNKQAEDCFAGVLEGNGHVLNGLSVIRYMFANTAETTVIRNIAFTNMKYLSNSAKSASTGLIYIARGGEISNCYFGGTFENTSNNCDVIAYANWGTAISVHNVIANMTTTVTSHATGGIGHDITKGTARHDNYAIGAFSTMYSGSTDGLYADSTAFFAGVTSLSAANGWSDLWAFTDEGLFFNGHKIIENS